MNEDKNKGEDFINFIRVPDERKDDSRYIPRWNVSNRVRYAVEDGMNIDECETRDLSCSGVCLKVRRLLLPGQKLKMKIYLDEDNAIEVSGRVIWNHIDRNGRYAGVNFDTATRQVQQEILNYAFEINHDEVVKHWFSDWKGKEKETTDQDN